MGTHGPAPATHGPSPKPRSVDEEQVRLMLQVQTLLSAKCIDEDELKKAEKKLKDLTERFDYGPAWLNLAELYSNGYEPGIEANPEEAARCAGHGGGPRGRRGGRKFFFKTDGAKISSAKISSAKVSSAKISSAKISSAKISSAKISSAEISSRSISPAKILSATVTTG